MTWFFSRSIASVIRRFASLASPQPANFTHLLGFLIVREEMLDLAPCDFRQIGIISDVRVSLRQFWYRYGAPLSVLQIFRSVVDDPAAGCARSAPAPSPPAQRPQHRHLVAPIGSPALSQRCGRCGSERSAEFGSAPSAIVAPNRNLRTTIPLRRNKTSRCPRA